MHKIAIVGFGFCGTMVFGNLIKEIIAKKPFTPIRFYIFDKEDLDNAGAGFSDFNDNYILNVPAHKMSAFHDKPNDFLEFIKINYPAKYNKLGDNGFYPRVIYGKYLLQLKNQFIDSAKSANIDVALIKAEVVDIKNSFEIIASNNILYNVDQVVLATSFPQSKLKLLNENNALSSDINNFVSPIWSSRALFFHKSTKINNNDNICIIGTGLSAVDVLVGLHAKNYTGKIYAVSRRGNFPKAHFSVSTDQKLELINPDDARYGIINLLLKIRKFLKDNHQYDLRMVIDSIRSTTRYLWQNLDDKNKQIFLKKLLPYWNIFRHRAPQTSLETISRMIKSGNLEIIKSSVKAVEILDDGFRVALKNHSNIQAKYLVNCLGFDFDVKHSSLLKKLLQNNLVQEDVISIRSLNKNLQLVGGLNIGNYFENTAVPDLRVDCHEVAKNLFKNIVK